jgi:hypothetical protein
LMFLKWNGWQVRASQAAEKLDPEGGGGGQPPHKAGRISAGFGPCGLFSYFSL